MAVIGRNKMAYSKDLRERIIAAVRKGELNKTEILKLFQISQTGLRYFLKHVDETGSLDPKPFGGGRRPKFQEEDIKKIKKYLDKNPDATLEEILEFSGKDASIMAVHRTLLRMGYRLKKSHYSPASKKEKISKSKERIGKLE
jgi:transposase